MSCQRKTVFRRCAALALGLLLAGQCSAPVWAGEMPGAETALTGEESGFSGVYVTGVSEGAGSFLLGSRVIRPGDVLTAGQLAQVTFSPAPSEEDLTAELSYLPLGQEGLQPQASMTVAIRGSRDDAPAAEDASLETYRNLPLEGQLAVTEPEGDTLTYTLIRSPKRGEVVIREDGSFLYTPKKNKVGTDSFTFTAADPAGNVSREATVTVRILKTDGSGLYTDTADTGCRFEAEWLKNTGIFSGEVVGGQSCFCPEKTVTRGQFLTMLMQTLELPVERSAVSTGFLDGCEDWMKPYLAAALRGGIIQGYPVSGGVEFRPDQPVTADEAAAMMSAALSCAVPTAALEGGAAASLSFPRGSQFLTRAEAAVALYQLYQTC